MYMFLRVLIHISQDIVLVSRTESVGVTLTGAQEEVSEDVLVCLARNAQEISFLRNTT